MAEKAISRKDVIIHLQVIHTWAIYGKENDRPDVLGAECVKVAQWAKEAIEFLETSVKPEIHGDRRKDGIWWFQCSVCKFPINPADKYCSECGKKVKWD